MRCRAEPHRARSAELTRARGGETSVLTESKDSLIYMSKYNTLTSEGEIDQRGPAGLYNLPISRARSLKYNASHMSFDFYHGGRQWAAKMIGKSMSVSQHFRGPNQPLDPWGFKHPRTVLLLPFWLGALHDKFVVVHVLRDGKDIVEGDNQKLFGDHCQPYYGRPCANLIQQRVEFWADLNMDVFEYALENLAPHQYVMVRVEDLVLGNEKCYRRLAAFMGLSPEQAAQLIPGAIAANSGHESSYLGNKWSDRLKARVENRVSHSDRAKAAFDFFGYSAEDYALTRDCDDLDWLKRVRERNKAKLPGDAGYVRRK